LLSVSYHKLSQLQTKDFAEDDCRWVSTADKTGTELFKEVLSLMWPEITDPVPEPLQTLWPMWEMM
jgi:hypothetical protein